MNLILIDGDIIVYRVGCVLENEGDWGIVKFNINNYIKEIIRHTNATHYDGFLTDSTHCLRRKLTSNYNAKIQELPLVNEQLGKINKASKPLKLIREYKSNRPDSRPKWYNPIREYLVDHWKFQMVEEIEADDAINITFLHHTKGETNPQYDIDELTICTTDKDFKQCAGARLYNPATKATKNISKEEAYYFHYWQILRGDNADGIEGITGIGDTKAHSILFGYPPYKFEEIVKLEYQFKYGEQGKDLYEITKQLLKFKNSYKDFIVPIPLEIPSTILSQSSYGSFLT